jgi:hypothetical protein
MEYSINMQPVVINNIITENVAELTGDTWGAYAIGGGVILGVPDNVYFSNNLIYNNKTIAHQDTASSVLGGGLASYTKNPRIVITNNIIYGNEALCLNTNGLGYGGGIYTDYTVQPNMANTIIWGNSATDEGNQVHGPWTLYHCCVEDGWTGAGSGNTDLDPLFLDAEHDDFHLTYFSPCIDAGDNVFVPEWLTQDHDGNPRFLNRDGYMKILDGQGHSIAYQGTVDIGPYEFIRSRKYAPPTVPPPNVSQSFQHSPDK